MKLIGAATLQSLLIARKFLPYCHRNTGLGRVLANATTPAWVYTFHSLQRVADSWTHLWSVMRRSYNQGKIETGHALWLP